MANRELSPHTQRLQKWNDSKNKKKKERTNQLLLKLRGEKEAVQKAEKLKRIIMEPEK